MRFTAKQDMDMVYVCFLRDYFYFKAIGDILSDSHKSFSDMLSKHLFSVFGAEYEVELNRVYSM